MQNKWEKNFGKDLEQLKDKHKIIREIRGKGLMIGIELKFEVKDILMDAIKKGVLLLIQVKISSDCFPPWSFHKRI